MEYFLDSAEKSHISRDKGTPWKGGISIKDNKIYIERKLGFSHTISILCEYIECQPAKRPP
jgi:hypothetical protein